MMSFTEMIVAGIVFVAGVFALILFDIWRNMPDASKTVAEISARVAKAPVLEPLRLVPLDFVTQQGQTVHTRPFTSADFVGVRTSWVTNNVPTTTPSPAFMDPQIAQLEAAWNMAPYDGDRTMVFKPHARPVEVGQQNLRHVPEPQPVYLGEFPVGAR
jgi:hypothetical protein